MGSKTTTTSSLPTTERSSASSTSKEPSKTTTTRLPPTTIGTSSSSISKKPSKTTTTRLPPTTIGSSPSATNGVGYKKGIDGYYYKYYKGGETWNDAQRMCQTEGGHLAIVWDSITQSVVTAFMKRGWIGATDQYEENHWQTPMKKDLPYLNWALGEPNDYGKREDCAAQRDNGLWNDLPCHHKIPFLCQYIPDLSTIPTTFVSTMSNKTTSPLTASTMSVTSKTNTPPIKITSAPSSTSKEPSKTTKTRSPSTTIRSSLSSISKEPSKTTVTGSLPTTTRSSPSSTSKEPSKTTTRPPPTTTRSSPLSTSKVPSKTTTTKSLPTT